VLLLQSNRWTNISVLLLSQPQAVADADVQQLQWWDSWAAWQISCCAPVPWRRPWHAQHAYSQLQQCGTAVSLLMFCISYRSTLSKMRQLQIIIRLRQTTTYPSCVMLCMPTGVTELTLGDDNTLRSYDVLPPNLKQLTAGNAEAASCLLPLTQLQQLELLCISEDAMPAAEMQQLTVLTALESIELVYDADAAVIDAAAAGWSALPLKHLHLFPNEQDNCLYRSTLQQLTSLTGLGDLSLGGCRLDNIAPDELAEVLTQINGFYRLSMHAVSWQQQQQQQGVAAADDGSSSPLAKFLQGLVSLMPAMPFIHLSLGALHVGRAEAAALAGMVGLHELVLQQCQLEDCSLAQIALELKPYLDELDVSQNPGVTDACLPVLAHAGISMRERDFKGTGVTREGLKRYMPSALAGKA
jgi:hypothetical protein